MSQVVSSLHILQLKACIQSASHANHEKITTLR